MKRLLLVILLLTFSGCEIKYSDSSDYSGEEYIYVPSGVTERTYIDYFIDGKIYGSVYQYNRYSATSHVLISTNGGIIFTYNGDGDVDTMTGTFSHGAIILTNSSTGIDSKTFIEWFEHYKTYSGYTFVGRKLTKDGIDYNYNSDGDVSTLTGTFSNGETILTATLDYYANISITEP